MDRFEATISRLFEKDTFCEDAFYGETVFADRKIIIYGAGEGFHWVSEILMRLFGFKPAVVLDRKFTAGDTFEGIPAFSPHAYQPTEQDKREAIVVICIGKKEYHSEIVNCLEGLGFQKIIYMMDIYEIHNPFSLPERLENEGFAYYKEQKDQILAGLNLFSDDESREIYTRCMQTHLRRKPVALPARPRQEQYFPQDIQLSRGYSRFVNCGAYDGDTIRLLNEVQGQVDEIACFECVPQLYDKLARYLWEYRETLARNIIIALPCAVYSREALMPFISGGGLGSRISEKGDTLVQSVALDHVLPGFNPTFICMDIEGAEPEALKGAEDIIKTSRPDLGICVYHAPHHLWQIPLYLHNLGLDYRFYLRNYTTFTSETVLYATI